MDHEGLEERNMDSSGFIRNYVEKHKRELEELRAKARALEFKGQWFIIGDDEYPQKRLQYATTSFEEAEVSPRIILYPVGEEDIQSEVTCQTCLSLLTLILVLFATTSPSPCTRTALSRDGPRQRRAQDIS